jgi:hypothetical protein
MGWKKFEPVRTGKDRRVGGIYVGYTCSEDQNC